MASVPPINKEFIVTNTIQTSNVSVPKLIVKSGIEEVMRRYFKKMSADCLEIFDPFIYCIVDAICKHMEMKGIKQPSGADVMESFRQIQGMIINVGNIHINNSIPTQEYTDNIIGMVLSQLDKSERIIIKDQISEPVKEPKKEIPFEEEFERDLKKYENFADDKEGNGHGKIGNGIKNKDADGKDNANGTGIDVEKV
jgi:hypothetical protein